MKISLHEASGRYQCVIGRRWNRAGKRLVKAQWYWSTDYTDSLRQAEQKKTEWRGVVAIWTDLWELVRVSYPGMEDPGPFWIRTATEHQSEQQARPSLQVAGSTLSVATLLELYQKELESRVGVAGRHGIKQTTYATHAYQIAGVLRYLPSPAAHLVSVDRAYVRETVMGIWKDQQLSERTMLNYTREFAGFLAWCTDSDALDWSLPKGCKRILEHRNVSPPIYVPSDDDLRSVYKQCKPRFRAAVILALNSGMTQADFAQANTNEEYMVWRRSKTSHQNDFNIVTWLWPETRAMVKEWGLRTRDGLPWYQAGKKGRNDKAAEFMRRAKKRAKLKQPFTFKSLRKYGADYINRTSGESVARLYLGQRIPGTLGRYSRDDFAPLTEGLRQLRAHLFGSVLQGLRASLHAGR